MAAKESLHQIKLFGLPLPQFILSLAIVVTAAAGDWLPGGMIGSLAFLIATGTLFATVGDRMPVIKDFLGGAPLVCVFGAAGLVYFQRIPEATVSHVNTFMVEMGFLKFYIASLVTGSLLGMDSKLLVKAGIRYGVPLLGGVVGTLCLVGLAGLISGFGFKRAILFIFFPIIGGGMGAGAVPMSEIVSNLSADLTPTQALSMFVPALALGNVFAIVAAGLLDKLGRWKPALTGNGILLKGFEVPKKEVVPITVEGLGTGLYLSCLFYILAQILSHYLPGIHSYAIMILCVTAVNLTNGLPDLVRRQCEQWFQFVTKNFTPALLVGIGIAYTDLGTILESFSPQFVFLVFMTILSVIVITGLLGMLVGFHFVESALTTGLGMADMGGTGDVAVLSAAKRMELMPFMQISSRLGGAFILILVSLLAPVLLQ